MKGGGDERNCEMETTSGGGEHNHKPTNLDLPTHIHNVASAFLNFGGIESERLRVSGFDNPVRLVG